MPNVTLRGLESAGYDLLFLSCASQRCWCWCWCCASAKRHGAIITNSIWGSVRDVRDGTGCEAASWLCRIYTERYSHC
ncbi:hypothetical protein IF1G_05094 [Cordyceps javanica]|uniref:Uncharacterized protein n=1 Tax=Cordyceps javanica TaxID=43265 RepID=A0A545V476_9HYPO|nr:hypothetical protein IF1G_05094 [Cordyceps javanica]